MAASNFAKRRVDVTFTIGTGDLGEGTPSTVTLTGLRVSANIVKAGGASLGNGQLRIMGMTLSHMNQVSTLGLTVMVVRKNTVSVTAGDDVSGMALVFEGTIFEAWADFQGAPEVVFNVVASTGLYDAVKPVPPSSYSGGADVAVIMSNLAEQMNFVFENSGVSVQLSNPYFPGTAREQAERCAKAADINMIMDDKTLAIWPKGTARGTEKVSLSPETGMVGYPTYTSNGIAVTCLFNPSIRFGGKIEVKSSLTPACGEWVVQTLAHSLESETPGGAWFTSLTAARQGYVGIR